MTPEQCSVAIAHAKKYVAVLPPWAQDYLVLSAQSTNSQPREPVRHVVEQPEPPRKQ